jgi:hypothetical protein
MRQPWMYGRFKGLERTSRHARECGSDGGRRSCISTASDHEVIAIEAHAAAPIQLKYF